MPKIKSMDNMLYREIRQIVWTNNFLRCYVEDFYVLGRDGRASTCAVVIFGNIELMDKYSYILYDELWRYGIDSRQVLVGA